MSDWHALAARSHVTRIAMHIPTPSGTNLAGKTYAACVSEDPDYSGASVVPDHATGFATEATALANGTVVEKVVEVRTPRGATNTQKRDAVDGLYAVEVTRVQAQIVNKYWAWGYSRDIP